MTAQKKVSVPERDLSAKLLKLDETIAAAQDLQGQIEVLHEQLVLDIIDGATTGDVLVDFLLVTEELRDTEVVARYDDLIEAVSSGAGRQILIIQKAEYPIGERTLILRNIYLALLRNDALKFDIDSMTFYIPVETGYLISREIVRSNTLVCGFALKESQWLGVGPLHSFHTYREDAREDQNGDFFVPHHARCEFELLPPESESELSEAHGIDQSRLRDLYRRWFTLKSRS